MPPLVRVALAIAELLAGGALGVMAGLWWARRSEPVDDEAATVDAPREPPLVEAYLRTQAGVVRSLNAHTSLQARLVAVSDSALEHAAGTRAVGLGRDRAPPGAGKRRLAAPAGALA